MELTEDVDYTHTGWRMGEQAFVDAPPHIVRLDVAERDDYNTWNNHVIAVAALRNQLRDAWWAALTLAQREEVHRLREAKIMADAQAWYAAQPAGSNRSFWD